MAKRKYVDVNGRQCCVCGRALRSGTYALRNDDRTWQCETPCQPAAADAATIRQVDYAVTLQASHWTPAVFGRDRYTTAELRAMSKTEISSVIDALLAERAL